MSEDYDVTEVQLSTIKDRIEDYSLTIFSPAGKGKTTLIANAFGNKVFFLKFEDGAKTSEVQGQRMFKWKDVLDFAAKCRKAIKAGKTLAFSVVCWDTFDLCGDIVSDYISDTFGAVVFTEEGKSAGYKLARQEVQNVQSELESYGLYNINLVHYAEKTIKRKVEKDQFLQGQMSVSNTFQKVIFDTVDLCGIILDEKMDDGTTEKRLWFRNEDYGLKSRIISMPDYIYLGEDEFEAGANFIKAFKKAVADEVILKSKEKAKAEATASVAPKKAKKSPVVEPDPIEEIKPVTKEVTAEDTDGQEAPPPWDDEAEGEDFKTTLTIEEAREHLTQYWKNLRAEGKIDTADIKPKMIELFGVDLTRKVDDANKIMKFLKDKE